MINMIMSDPELVKMVIMAIVGIAIIPIAERISKKVPDYTGEENEK